MPIAGYMALRNVMSDLVKQTDGALREAISENIKPDDILSAIQAMAKQGFRNGNIPKDGGIIAVDMGELFRQAAQEEINGMKADEKKRQEYENAKDEK